LTSPTTSWHQASSILLGQSEINLLIDNRAESKIRQGITTELTGELYSVAPLRAAFTPSVVSWFAVEPFKVRMDWTDLTGYLVRLERQRTAINLGTFVGAASVRAAVLGLGDVQPTPAQLAEMQRLVSAAMDEGAFGVSSPLGYPPGSFARTPELTALAAVAAEHGSKPRRLRGLRLPSATAPEPLFNPGFTSICRVRRPTEGS
jgi:dihydroorotase/N-acyl-D-amino-acid deacylase